MNNCKLLLLTCIVFFSTGCPNGNNPAVSKLIKLYSAHDMSYINDCPVSGAVNPRELSFTLILDTLNPQQAHIINIESQNLIIPLLHKPGYGIFYMAVKNTSSDYYEVYLNGKDAGFVKKDEFYFFSWEELLMGTLSIRAESGLKERNNPESTITFDDHATFDVLNVDDDWVFAKESDEDENFKSTETGYWIKWREDGRLLITPHLLM